MPRLTITAPDGTPMARGVYPVPDARLLHVGSTRNFIPAGACLRIPSDAISLPNVILPDGLWLCHADELGGWPRAEHFCGCCGPDGSEANILHPHLGEPVAYEAADCHTDRSLRLAPGAWTEEIEDADDDGDAWVGWVQLPGMGKESIAAAIGRDEAEARHRLERACSDYIAFRWRRRSAAWRRQHLTLHATPATEWLRGRETS